LRKAFRSKENAVRIEWGLEWWEARRTALRRRIFNVVEYTATGGEKQAAKAAFSLTLGTAGGKLT
jgi:hypothetical protein